MDSNSMKKKELYNCSFSKMIMMFVIILYHSLFFASGVDFVAEGNIRIPKYTYSAILDWFSSFQNYTFVFISGYIYCYIVNERKGYGNFKEFIANKTRRLLVPFLCVSAFWGIPFSIFFYRLSFSEVIVRWVLGTNPDQLWFLLMLFEVFIISRLLTKMYNNHSIASYVLLIFLYFIGAILQLKVLNVYRIFNTLQMLLFFRIGYDFRKSSFRKNTLLFISLSSHIVLFIIAEVLRQYSGGAVVIIRLVVQLPLRIAGCIFVFLILQKIANLFDGKLGSLDSINKYTMPIYLFHQQFIYIIIRAINGRINIYISAMIAFIVSLLCAFILSKLLMKYKFTRFFIGVS